MKASDNRETPPQLFKELEDWYKTLSGGHGFRTDVAATQHNTKVQSRFITEHGLYEDGSMHTQGNGLDLPWGEHWFCNPPYSELTKPKKDVLGRELHWVARASLLPFGLMLLPSKTEQAWWQTWIEPHRDGRLRDSGAGLAVTTKFLPGRGQFHIDGQPIPARDGDGEIIRRKDGTPRVGSGRFGLVAVAWVKR